MLFRHQVLSNYMSRISLIIPLIAAILSSGCCRERIDFIGISPEGKETAKIIYLEFGFAPPTEKIVIDLENEKISYEFSYTIGKIGKEG